MSRKFAMPIPRFPGYRATRDGRVQTCKQFSNRGWTLGKRWRDLKQTPNRQGYLSVRLTRDGKQYDMQVAHAVLFAFVGPKPRGMVARHLDDNNTNNLLSNLKWGTHQQNAEDRRRNGKPRRRPEVLGQLDRIGVQRIWKLHRAGWKQGEIAPIVGVARMTVGNVIRGRSWKHVPEDPDVELPPGVTLEPPERKRAADRREDPLVAAALAAIDALAACGDGHEVRCKLHLISRHARTRLVALVDARIAS